MRAEKKLWYLKRVDLLSGLTDEELRQVDQMTRMLSFRRRQTLFFQGDPGGYVYCLKSGRVKISRISPEGKELILDIVLPGEIFGEIFEEGEAAQGTTAEALEDVLVCVIPREQFEQLLRARPDLSFRLSKLIGLRLRRIESRVEDLVFKDVPSRLATVLLQLAGDHGSRESLGVVVRPCLTQTQLASLIGASREVVNQTLAEFRRQGLIVFDRRRVIISDQHALARLASLSPAPLFRRN